MPEACTLRPALAADAATIAAQRAAMFRDMGDLHPDDEAPLRAAVVAWMERAIPAGDYVGWLACAPGGAAIGGAGMQLGRVMPRPRPRDEGTGVFAGMQGLVVNVYVEPSWRRRGVGDALMRRLVADARDRGVGRLVLHASADGRPLYERLGFLPSNEMRLWASAYDAVIAGAATTA